MNDSVFFALLISILLITVYSVIDKKIEFPRKSFNVSVTRGELVLLAFIILFILIFFKDRINKFINSIFYDKENEPYSMTND
jgi:predicted PurR-regulated permease PerM